MRISLCSALPIGLVFITACSGGSGPVSSATAPSAMSNLSGGATLASDPGTTPCEQDPKLPECQPKVSGRFTGGGFQIDENGVRVTRGFTLHCDAILSNNFEVNWAGGNHFHIDKNPTTVRCLKPGVPNPPDAPVNLIEVRGPGKLNGVPGATIQIVLIDNGEPGTRDQAFIAINGGSVLSVGGDAANPGTIDGGNIQAHFDQPHR